jgi:small conductance mechanosensitive channel
MNPERIYEAAWNWLLTTGPKILIAVILFIAGEWLIRIVRRRINRKLEKKKVSRGIYPFIQGLMVATLHVLLILLVMQVAGVRLTIFAAVIAAFGAAAGFALSGTLQNFASGVIILLLKPFKVGDRIFAQGQEGVIAGIQLFYTMMTTYDNRTIIFPNSKVSNEVIVNNSTQGKRRYEVEIKLSYQVPVQQVREVVLNSIKDEKEIDPDPKADLAVVGFDPDGYRVQIFAWLTNTHFYSKRFMLNEKILSALNTSGLKK